MHNLGKDLNDLAGWHSTESLRNECSPLKAHFHARAASVCRRAARSLARAEADALAEVTPTMLAIRPATAADGAADKFARELAIVLREWPMADVRIQGRHPKLGNAHEVRAFVVPEEASAATVTAPEGTPPRPGVACIVGDEVSLGLPCLPCDHRAEDYCATTGRCGRCGAVVKPPCSTCGGTKRVRCPRNDTCGKGIQCQMQAVEEDSGICIIPCDCEVTP